MYYWDFLLVLLIRMHSEIRPDCVIISNYILSVSKITLTSAYFSLCRGKQIKQVKQSDDICVEVPSSFSSLDCVLVLIVVVSCMAWMIMMMVMTMRLVAGTGFRGRQRSRMRTAPGLTD